MRPLDTSKIAIIGPGRLGTALAYIYGRNGKPVTIYYHDAEVCRTINEEHLNPKHLTSDLARLYGGMENVPRLAPEVTASSDLEQVVHENDFIFLTITMNRLSKRDLVGKGDQGKSVGCCSCRLLRQVGSKGVHQARGKQGNHEDVKKIDGGGREEIQAAVTLEEGDDGDPTEDNGDYLRRQEDAETRQRHNSRDKEESHPRHDEQKHPGFTLSFHLSSSPLRPVDDRLNHPYHKSDALSQAFFPSRSRV